MSLIKRREKLDTLRHIITAGQEFGYDIAAAAALFGPHSDKAPTIYKGPAQTNIGTCFDKSVTNCGILLADTKVIPTGRILDDGRVEVKPEETGDLHDASQTFLVNWLDLD